MSRSRIILVICSAGLLAMGAALVSASAGNSLLTAARSQAFILNIFPVQTPPQQPASQTAPADQATSSTPDEPAPVATPSTSDQPAEPAQADQTPSSQAPQSDASQTPAKDTDTTTQKLPKTASPVPLIGLIGWASFGGAYILRRFGRKAH